MLLAAVLVCVNAYALTVDTTSTPGSTIVTSDDGTWTKSYTNVHTPANTSDIPATQYEATILNSAGLGEDGLNYANIGNAGDIVVGGSGYLNLQTWTQGSISLNNDIYLGSSTNTKAALWLKEASGTIQLNGALNLVEDSSVWMEGAMNNAVTINGNTSGSAYTLTTKGLRNTTFNGTVSLGGLATLASSNIAVTELKFANSTTIGTLTTNNATKLTFDAAGKTATIGNVAGSGAPDLAVTAGTVLNIENGTSVAISSLNNAGSTTIGVDAVTIGDTIMNNGSLEITGSITVTDANNFSVAKQGEYTGAYSNGTNGWKVMSGLSYYLVDTESDSSELSITADTITVGSTSGVKLDKTSEAGKVIFAAVDEGYDSNSTYYVNSGTETMASTTASSYAVEEGATLKFTDDVTGSNSYNVTGSGTLEVNIAATSGHGKNVRAENFNGILAITKTGGEGNTMLTEYVLGKNAKFKLISGNHWGGGTISREIILAGAAEGDYKFRHDGTLTLAGKVTGTHLYAGRNYDNTKDNNLILSGAGTNIANVKMTGGTLTVANDMQFGTVNAPKVVLNEGKTLAIGDGSTATTSVLENLELGSSSTLNVQSQATLQVANTSGSGAVVVHQKAALLIDTMSNGEIAGGVTLKNGATMTVRQGYYEQTFTSDILVDGDAVLQSGWGGENGKIAGKLTGAGKVTLGQPVWGTGFSENSWILESAVSDKSTTEKLSVVSNANVTISGDNNYSGGTTVAGRTLTTASENALGTGKVTMNSGTLTQNAALNISAMDYNGGTVNNNGQNLKVEGALKIADNTAMTIDGAGTNDIGTLALGAGLNADAYALTTTGTLTLGSLSLDLTDYVAGVYKLVSSAGLTWTAGSYTTMGLAEGLTAQVGYAAGSSTNLILTIGEVVTPGSPDWSLTSTPSYDAVTEMLTLNVEADLLGYDFTNDGAIIIPGISDAMMKDILGLNGLPEDGMVGITLVGGDGGSITAVGDQQIGFLSKEGVGSYFGQNVDGVWQYQVAYIPEPATTTLSLLALAGLALRRRRKA